jgi:purine-cytosine permease-like protein
VTEPLARKSGVMAASQADFSAPAPYIWGMPSDDDVSESDYADTPYVPTGPRRSTFTPPPRSTSADAEQSTPPAVDAEPAAPVPSGTGGSRDADGSHGADESHDDELHDDDELANALADQVAQYTATGSISIVSREAELSAAELADAAPADTDEPTADTDEPTVNADEPTVNADATPVGPEASVEPVIDSGTVVEPEPATASTAPPVVTAESEPSAEFSVGPAAVTSESAPPEFEVEEVDTEAAEPAASSPVAAPPIENIPSTLVFDENGLPVRPQRTSLPDELLVQELDEEARGSGDTLGVIGKLESQLQLRQEEAREFTNWEAAMLVIGTPEALDTVEQARPEFAGVVPPTGVMDIIPSAAPPASAQPTEAPSGAGPETAPLPSERFDPFASWAPPPADARQPGPPPPAGFAEQDLAERDAVEQDSADVEVQAETDSGNPLSGPEPSAVVDPEPTGPEPSAVVDPESDAAAVVEAHPTDFEALLSQPIDETPDDTPLPWLAGPLSEGATEEQPESPEAQVESEAPTPDSEPGSEEQSDGDADAETESRPQSAEESDAASDAASDDSSAEENDAARDEESSAAHPEEDRDAEAEPEPQPWSFSDPVPEVPDIPAPEAVDPATPVFLAPEPPAETTDPTTDTDSSEEGGDEEAGVVEELPPPAQQPWDPAAPVDFLEPGEVSAHEAADQPGPTTADESYSPEAADEDGPLDQEPRSPTAEEPSPPVYDLIEPPAPWTPAPGAPVDVVTASPFEVLLPEDEAVVAPFPVVDQVPLHPTFASSGLLGADDEFASIATGSQPVVSSYLDVEFEDDVDEVDRAFPDPTAVHAVSTDGVVDLAPITAGVAIQPLASPRIPTEQVVLDDSVIVPQNPKIFSLELSGEEPTPVEQRVGRASRMFWLWFATNSSVVSVAFGGALFSLGISLRQAILAAFIGVAISFLPLGLGTLAGKWSGQPTLVVSRATFGIAGNILPAVLALLTRLFWGAVLLWLLAATSARILVGARLSGGVTELQLTLIVMAVGFIVALVIAYFGYPLFSRLQLVLSALSAVLIIGLIALTWHAIDFRAALTVGDGPWVLLITGIVLVFSFVGLIWASSGGDLARYQRPQSSGATASLWASFGATLPAFVLVSYGALLAASDPETASGLASTPIDTIAGLIPSWYPIPLLIATALSLLSGVTLSIYSGAFALQAVGVRLQRQWAVAAVGVLLFAVAILLTFTVGDLPVIFRDVATSLAVPVAAWAGIFAAEMIIRRRRFDAVSLLKPGGVYPQFNWINFTMLIVAAVIGYGFTSATVAWLSWQGYGFTIFGVSLTSEWGGTDIGVLIALVLGLLTPFVSGVRSVRRQERAYV